MLLQEKIAEAKRNRYEILKKVFEKSEGNSLTLVDDEELQKELGLSRDEFCKYIMHLNSDGFVWLTSNTTSITPAGIKEVEAVELKPSLLTEVVNLSNDRIRLEIAIQNKELPERIELIKNEHSMRGLGTSGPAAMEVCRACCEVIDQRGQIIWKAIQTVVTATLVPYSSELAPQLKDIVKTHLPKELTDIKTVLRNHIESIGFGALSQSLDAEIYATRERVLQTVSGDIDLFVLSRKSGIPGRSKDPPSNKEVTSEVYVDLKRIEELRSISSDRFDLLKLIELCAELNKSYSNQSFLAVGMLMRSVLDHVPPIFECKTFVEVANNYKGSKSFKESMGNLEKSLRNIADAHLHTQIRKKESLPTKTQVSFSPDLDVLLAEICRILK